MRKREKNEVSFLVILRMMYVGGVGDIMKGAFRSTIATHSCRRLPLKINYFLMQKLYINIPTNKKNSLSPSLQLSPGEMWQTDAPKKRRGGRGRRSWGRRGCGHKLQTLWRRRRKKRRRKKNRGPDHPAWLHAVSHMGKKGGREDFSQ